MIRGNFPVTRRRVQAICLKRKHLIFANQFGNEAEAVFEQDVAPVEELAADAMAGALGVVEKIDFDSLTFNMDDE